MSRIRVDHIEPDREDKKKKERVAEEEKELTTKQELKRKSGSAVMSAFSAYPQAIHFSGEHEEEKIILLLRAHIITNVPWILISIFLALVPMVIFPLALALGILPPVGLGMSVVLTLLWYLGIFTYAFLNALYWYFNVGIVTDERVIDIDWNSITHRDVATAQMSQVQDVREVQSGPLAGIFDFGDVMAQTAGTEPNIEFLKVPHPQLVVRTIQELMTREEKEWEHA